MGSPSSTNASTKRDGDDDQPPQSKRAKHSHDSEASDGSSLSQLDHDERAYLTKVTETNNSLLAQAAKQVHQLESYRKVDLNKSAQLDRVKQELADVASKLAEMEERPEHKNLQQILAKHQDEIQEREALLQRYQDVDQDKSRALTKYKEELLDMQDSMCEYCVPRDEDHQIETVREQMRQLQAEMQLKEEGFRAARDELVARVHSLEADNRLNLTKVTDTEIISYWGSLVSLVRQFVDVHCNGSSAALTDNPRWKTMLSKPETFFASPHLYSIVFEAHIWYWLSNMIFRPKARGWAGDVGRDFFTLVEKAQEKVANEDKALREFNEWRSRSYTQIFDLESCEERTARHEKSVQHILTQLFAPRTDLAFDWDNAALDMQEIFESAVHLDSIFRQSKAMFVVRDAPIAPKGKEKKKHGIKYNTNFMAVHENLSQVVPDNAKIDVIVRPCLVKNGNADGFFYESKKILVNMVVGILPSPPAEESNDGEETEPVRNKNSKAPAQPSPVAKKRKLTLKRKNGKSSPDLNETKVKMEEEIQVQPRVEVKLDEGEEAVSQGGPSATEDSQETQKSASAHSPSPVGAMEVDSQGGRSTSEESREPQKSASAYSPSPAIPWSPYMDPDWAPPRGRAAEDDEDDEDDSDDNPFY